MRAGEHRTTPRRSVPVNRGPVDCESSGQHPESETHLIGTTWTSSGAPRGSSARMALLHLWRPTGCRAGLLPRGRAGIHRARSGHRHRVRAAPARREPLTWQPIIEHMSGIDGRSSSPVLPLETFGSFTVPPGYRPVTIDRCRACGQSILWCYTRNDRYSPHDHDGTSHFATCPRADSYRRRRERIRRR